MDVTPLISSKNSVVQSYGPSGFRISGQTYDHNIIVYTNHVEGWNNENFEDLSIESFNSFLKQKPDVLFIGTGKTMKHLSADLRAKLKEKGLNVETMDTGAACRTFNALMSDGRQIVALLFLPE